MKRLFSILLINSWNGLRHKASLPTLGMVVIGLMALLVTSTVAAGASPKSSAPDVGAVASIIHHSLLESLPLHVFVNSSKGASPSLHRSQAVPNVVQQSAGSGGVVGPSAPAGTSTGPVVSSQSSPQLLVPSLSLVSIEQPCQQGQTTYAISSAQLTLQTPTVAGDTVSGYWETETRTDSGNNVGQPSTDSVPFTQPITAGETSITIVNPTDPTKPLYSTDSNTSYAYSFQLHITSPVDVVSGWVSVPETANSCPTSN